MFLSLLHSTGGSCADSGRLFGSFVEGCSVRARSFLSVGGCSGDGTSVLLARIAFSLSPGSGLGSSFGRLLEDLGEDCGRRAGPVSSGGDCPGDGIVV